MTLQVGDHVESLHNGDRGWVGRIVDNRVMVVLQFGVQWCLKKDLKVIVLS
jgi:hypothetical protein